MVAARRQRNPPKTAAGGQRKTRQRRSSLPEKTERAFPNESPKHHPFPFRAEPLNQAFPLNNFPKIKTQSFSKRSEKMTDGQLKALPSSNTPENTQLFSKRSEKMTDGQAKTAHKTHHRLFHNIAPTSKNHRIKQQRQSKNRSAFDFVLYDCLSRSKIITR